MTPASPWPGDAELALAWREALRLWDVETTLSPPERLTKEHGHWGGADPLAYIDLERRQVVVNFPQLERLGARRSLRAVLAHEIGHHVRFPHTLGLAAELRAMEVQLIPLLAQSLTNLFFDLQVNEVVGRTEAEALAAVYRGFVAETPEVPPLFYFYLCVYEELWGLDAGALAPVAVATTMEKQYPSHRADARMFVQTFYDLDDVYLQFTYFCSRFIRYVPDPSKLSLTIALGHDVPRPGADDHASAAGGNDAVERALEEALRRGWLSAAQGERSLREGAWGRTRKATLHRPGSGTVPYRIAKASDAYRSLVERYLIEPPGVETPPEPYLPSTAEPWEAGDGLRAIDWPLSVSAHGPLAPIAPLRRDLLADEPPVRGQGLPAMEIYLDTSGSMPSPDGQVNALTLAAQILSTSVLRKGGTVRGVVYSSDCIYSDWMYHEEVARVFFLSYSGGGTSFPFGLLRRFARERRDVIRVVISDSDFLWNMQAQGYEELDAATEPDRRDGTRAPADALSYAVARSTLLVVLLGLPNVGVKASLGAAASHPRFRLVTVSDYAALAQAARDLARAILD